MTEEQFLTIISEALEVEASEISLDTKMYDIENWDSLGQLTILSRLDDSTDGKTFSISALGSMTKLADIFDAVNHLEII